VHVRAVAPGWPCLLRSCIAGLLKAEVVVEGETDARGVKDVAAAPGGGGEEGGISGAGDVFFFFLFRFYHISSEGEGGATRMVSPPSGLVARNRGSHTHDPTWLHRIREQ